MATTTTSSSSDLLSSSSSSTDTVVQITIPVSTKLDRDNFLTWRSQVEPIILGFDLSRHIDSAYQPPEPNLIVEGVSKSNPQFARWNKQDQLLLGWLRSTISGPVLSQYVAYKTPCSLWQALHHVYSATSSARVMDLRRSLQTKNRGGQTCSEFFAHMLNLADQLATAGAPIPDSDMVSYILSGLGSDYNSFIIALTTRSDPVSLADLHGFLLSHENLLAAQHKSSSSDPVVFYSAPSSRGRDRRSNRGRRGSGPPAHGSGHAGKGSASIQGILPTPQYSNSVGRGGSGPTHNMGSGPNSHNRGSFHYQPGRGSVSSSQIPADLPICQVCCKKRHEALDCWYRYDLDYSREAEAQYQAYYNTTTPTPSGDGFSIRMPLITLRPTSIILILSCRMLVMSNFKSIYFSSW